MADAFVPTDVRDSLVAQLNDRDRHTDAMFRWLCRLRAAGQVRVPVDEVLRRMLDGPGTERGF